jgi:hypothetical protein
MKIFLYATFIVALSAGLAQAQYYGYGGGCANNNSKACRDARNAFAEHHGGRYPDQVYNQWYQGRQGRWNQEQNNWWYEGMNGEQYRRNHDNWEWRHEEHERHEHEHHHHHDHDGD